MATQLKPICPRCGTNKHVVPAGSELFRCTNCGGLLDGDPDEGGDFSTHNPAARLEREERARERKLDRLGRRR